MNNEKQHTFGNGLHRNLHILSNMDELYKMRYERFCSEWGLIRIGVCIRVCGIDYLKVRSLP